MQRRLDEVMAVAGIALDGEERFARRDRAGVDRKPRHARRQRACALRAHRRRHRLDRPQRRAHAASPFRVPGRERSGCTASGTVELASCHLLPQRRRDRLVIAERQRAVADDLAGFMALAGDQQHVAGRKRRDRAADRLAAVADLASRRRAPARIAARIAPGFSLRGLSSVTMTRSASLRRRSRPSAGACRRRGRRRRRTPRPAAASHRAAAPPAPSPARRACGRSRRRSARRCSRRPDRAGPWRP